MKTIPPRRGPGRPPNPPKGPRPVAPASPSIAALPPMPPSSLLGMTELDAEDAAFEEIAEILVGLPADSDVFVYRLPPTGGKRESLGSLDTASFSIDFIAQRWGAGRYYLTFRAPNPDFHGRRQPVTNKVVVIGEGHLAIKPSAPTTGSTVQPSTIQQAMDAGVLNLITSAGKMLQMAGERPSSDSGLKDVLLELAKQRAEDQRMFLNLIMEMNKGRASAVDPVDMALKMAQMMKGGSSSLSEIKELFGLVVEMTEGGRKGEGESDDLMTTAAKGFMRVLEGLLARGQLGATPTAPTPAAPQLLSGTPEAAAPSAGGAPPTPASPASSPPATPEMMQRFLAQFMGKALEFAKQKRDPRVYAAVMFDALDGYPVQVRQVAAAMLAETENGVVDAPFTAEAKLRQAFPDMLAHPEFFTEFLEELRIKFGILTEEDDDDVVGAIEPPGSDGGNDADDDMYSAPDGVPTT